MGPVDVLNVKIPEEQKKTLEDLVVEKQYPSVSEYVREALRDKMERELELSDQARDGIKDALARDEWVAHEDVVAGMD